MQKVARLAAVVAFLAAAPIASAQYTQTLPEYIGHTSYSSYPSAPFTIGTYTGIPGGTITSATISGFFGNSYVPNTADVRVFLNSILVAQCQSFASGPTSFAVMANAVTPSTDCGYSQTPTPWSYTFSPSEFSALSGPTAALTGVQDSDYYTQLGATTLTINYANVTTTPEPSSMALLGTGLVGLVPMVRRRRK